MKLRQIFFAFAFIAPLLTLPIEGTLFTEELEESLSPEINNEWLPGAEWIDWRNGLSYTTESFEGTVWMTKNFKNVLSLMTYQEAVNAAPEGWSLPTAEEWDDLFKLTGFEGKPNDLIPSTYYNFNFQAEGFEDPLVGITEVDRSGMYWAESIDVEGDYINVPSGQLKYEYGKTSKLVKMAVRYVKR